MTGRCRLCTTKDREALIVELAARMNENGLDIMIDGRREEAGMCQAIMRQFAEAMLKMLKRGRR